MNSSLDFTELATIISLNSYTKNKAGVDHNADIFNAWMEQLGFSVETHRREAIGNHVHYLSKKSEGAKLLLLGHLDTVFPPDTFTEFREDDEWIYGPGVCDMKGGNYIALTALRNVFAEQGHIANIDMLLVSDEESGSDDSKLLTSELAKAYDACMVFEAAGPDHDVVISRKGIATFQIEFEGKGAHAGNHYTDGINANLAAAHMLIALTNLTDLEKGTTVNAGKMKGGLGANTISPSASLTVEARFTQSEERDRVLAAFEEVTQNPAVEGVKVVVTGGLQRDVMQPTEAQAQFIAELESVLGAPLKLEKRGGVSDANVVSAAGVPTLDGFGPYGDGDHTIHERASKSSFERRIGEVSKILAHFNSAN
ncbi:M20 family metallopeptidase [Alteromonas sp. MMG017]|uniref:M20 family metallopeptidase n=1 Tax=Alteromonas sp. MMG017 TaxID=2822692 RepID=UPI001B3A6B84|nr:M20 family metallopeptidase [Alteromonas sp. MMG017]MBQ4829475.1 M20 family metallopeptidase [Alteromonas sp. MMG017]